MKKVLLVIFSLVFIAAIILVIKVAADVLKPDTKEETEIKTSYVNYYKAHGRQIGEAFLVDSILYTVTGFTYTAKPDSMILIVDVSIQNKRAVSAHFENRDFPVKGDKDVIYFPTQIPFTVFENRTQQLKFIYHLPERRLPIMSSELLLNSKTDSIQNAIIILAKRYRSEG